MKPYRALTPFPGALPIPDQNNVVVLAANTVKSVTIPAGAAIARVIAYGGFAAVLADADPPNVADLKDGTAGYGVGPGDPLWIDLQPEMIDLRFNSAGTPTLGVSFWGKAG